MDFTKINPKNIYTLSKYGAFDLNGNFFLTGWTEFDAIKKFRINNSELFYTFPLRKFQIYDLESTLNFGKYNKSELNISQIIVKEKDYILWMIKNLQFAIFSERVLQNVNLNRNDIKYKYNTAKAIYYEKMLFEREKNILFVGNEEIYEFDNAHSNKYFGNYLPEIEFNQPIEMRYYQEEFRVWINVICNKVTGNIFTGRHLVIEGELFFLNDYDETTYSQYIEFSPLLKLNYKNNSFEGFNVLDDIKNEILNLKSLVHEEGFNLNYFDNSLELNILNKEEHKIEELLFDDFISEQNIECYNYPI